MSVQNVTILSKVQLLFTSLQTKVKQMFKQGLICYSETQNPSKVTPVYKALIESF